MPIKTAGRVKETTTTTGTGAVTLAGTASTYETFGTRLADGDTVHYAIVHQTADEYETGTGTYTAAGTTLTRTTVWESSNSDAAVSFSAGTKDVWIDQPAKTIDPYVLYVQEGEDIQTAVDALPTEGGKIVVLEGSYELSEPIELPDNTTLELRGAIIYCQDTYAPSNYHTVNTEPVYSIVKNADVTGNSNILITGYGRIHGDMTTGLDEGVSWAGVHFHIGDNCAVRGDHEYAIEIDHIAYDITGQGGTGGSHRFFCFLATQSDKCHLSNTECHHSGDDAVSFRRTCTECSAHNNWVYGNKWGHGIQSGGSASYVFGGTGTQRNIRFYNNVVEAGANQNRAEGGISSHSSEECLIYDNHISGVGTGVFLLGTSKNCQVNNNYIEDCRWRGMLCAAASEAGDITECSFNDNTVHIVTAGDAWNCGLEIETSNATTQNVNKISVRNLTVHGSDGNTQTGILIKAENGRTIENVNVTGLTVDTVGSAGCYIWAEGSGAIVQDMNVSGFQISEAGYGVIVVGANSGTARRVVVSGGSVISARLLQSSGSLGSRGVRFNNCTDCICTSVRAKVTGLAFSDVTSADKNVFSNLNAFGSSTTSDQFFQIEGTSSILKRAGKGADIASANEMATGVNNSNSLFFVTGTTTINHINKTNWTPGEILILKFNSSVTVTHVSGTPTGTEADILLTGSVDFSATASDTLSLVYDGTYFREVGRAVI